MQEKSIIQLKAMKKIKIQTIMLLLYMMKILQAPIQDVVVFGDDYNDLDMFDKDLWTGVAMGNACDALKEKATYITDQNVDDGIYNICEKMGWF